MHATSPKNRHSLHCTKARTVNVLYARDPHYAQMSHWFPPTCSICSTYVCTQAPKTPYTQGSHMSITCESSTHTQLHKHAVYALRNVYIGTQTLYTQSRHIPHTCIGTATTKHTWGMCAHVSTSLPMDGHLLWWVVEVG